MRGDDADIDVRSHRDGREVEIQPTAGRDVTDVLDRGRLNHGWIDAEKRQADEKGPLAHTGCPLCGGPFIRAYIGGVRAHFLFLFPASPRRVERLPGAKRAPRRLENNGHGRRRAVAMQDCSLDQIAVAGDERGTQCVGRQSLPRERINGRAGIANHDLLVRR
jgi:hypothetical protein